MFTSIIRTLKRLLALLTATGTLAQANVSIPGSNSPSVSESAQYPAYASLLPDASFFDGDHYLGDNALVLLERHSSRDGALSSAYILADIYVPDVHCLQTWYQDDPVDTLEGPADIQTAARAVHAAYAVNGDYYTLQGVNCVRNGTVLNSCICNYDLCVLYEDGTLRTWHHDLLSSQAVVDKALTGAWQAWSFGPLLLSENGEAISDFTDRVPEYFTQLHPRTAIGYFGPGHYCIVTVSGYQNGIPGVSLEELSRFFADLGCLQAYNLDGGGSTHVWFHGRETGFPSQAGALADLIYIQDTSSWEGRP